MKDHFNDAVVDEFDFYSENSNQIGYVGLIRVTLMSLPDQSVDLLKNFPIDSTFIPFYNNYSFHQSFNWNSWSDFTKSTLNKTI